MNQNISNQLNFRTEYKAEKTTEKSSMIERTPLQSVFLNDKNKDTSLQKSILSNSKGLINSISDNKFHFISNKDILSKQKIPTNVNNQVSIFSKKQLTNTENKFVSKGDIYKVSDEQEAVEEELNYNVFGQSKHLKISLMKGEKRENIPEDEYTFDFNDIELYNEEDKKSLGTFNHEEKKVLHSKKTDDEDDEITLNSDIFITQDDLEKFQTWNKWVRNDEKKEELPLEF